MKPVVEGTLSQELLDELTNEELFLYYKETGDESVKWPLVLRYTNLVKTIALQVRGVYHSFAQVEDVINEGLIVLLGAVDKFDPSQGNKFETFASKRLRGAIIDLARKQDWIPRSVRRRNREFDEASGELFGQLGRLPTDQEMAEKLGVSVEKYQEDLSGMSLSSVMSLEMVFEDREPQVAGLPGSIEPTRPEDNLLKGELFETLVTSIEKLQENEQQILSLYYHKNLNMKEVAQVMGISTPRVSQLHARAIQKLKVLMEGYIINGDAISREEKIKL
ncbi:MAG: FliA/WhiG family RNA polymerase sigma factor [Eubacteriales bacterium]